MKSAVQFKKIMLYLPPTDMRKQVMGLAEMVDSILEEDPFEDCLYLFCNRRRDIVKGLYFDRAGFCLWMKKLDREKFPWLTAHDGKMLIESKDLDLLLEGVDVFKRHKRLTFESIS